jgi:hypothetical protein
MDDRPVLTASKMLASATVGVVTAALTGAIAVGIARDPGALWRPLLIGAGVFGLVSLFGSLLLVRILRTLDPEPLPPDCIPQTSTAGAIAARIRAPATLLIAALIALFLAASDPIQAVYVASIGLGTAPGFVCMAWLVRSWERTHGMRLVGPTRSTPTSRRTTYSAISGRRVPTASP